MFHSIRVVNKSEVYMERVITNRSIQDFKIYLKENERSSATINKYIHDVLYFKFFADKCVVDKNLVIDYKSHLAGKYAISSANSMIAALNAYFRFQSWYDCLVKQFHVQRKVYCKETQELTKSDYIKLLNTTSSNKNIRLNLILQTICSTGIRVSELPFITVEAVERGEAIITCKGKTRTVFIVSKLRNKLMNYAKKNNISSGQIFVTRSGKPIDRSNIWKEMKKLCADAEVAPDKVFPHNLRHLFARTFYNIDKDIAKLSDILGHTSINTTRIYIISTGEEHRRQMESMRLVV